MAYVLQIQLENINESLQVGDTIYYSSVETIGTGDLSFRVSGNSFSDLIKIGECSFINTSLQYIRVSGSLNVNPPVINSFIFFSKDNSANLSSAKGYYAEVKMVNNDNNNKSELFQIALEADVSSK